jgi:hypothetical protein
MSRKIRLDVCLIVTSVLFRQALFPFAPFSTLITSPTPPLIDSKDNTATHHSPSQSVFADQQLVLYCSARPTEQL